MRQRDLKDKREKSVIRYWKDLFVPDVLHYASIVERMDADYSGMCPVCFHPDLIFGQEAGVWQASKDRMIPGLAYGDPAQVMRWCCTCCNNALQEASDRVLHTLFVKIILNRNLHPRRRPMSIPLTQEQRAKVKTVFAPNRTNGKKKILEMGEKGYTIAPGVTADDTDVLRLASIQRHCQLTGAPVEFNNGPACISLLALIFVIITLCAYFPDFFSLRVDEAEFGIIEAAEDTPAADLIPTIWTKRQQRIADAFFHSWDNYKEYAWGLDILKPISKSSEQWFYLGLTIIDSFDTLHLIGRTDERSKAEFELARKWLEHDSNLGLG